MQTRAIPDLALDAGGKNNIMIVLARYAFSEEAADVRL
jgi:hypothetical protein